MAESAADRVGEGSGRRDAAGGTSVLRHVSLGLLAAALLAGLLVLGHTGAPAAALGEAGAGSWPTWPALAQQPGLDSYSSDEGEANTLRGSGKCVGSLCQYLDRKGRWVRVGVDKSYSWPATALPAHAEMTGLAERRIGFDSIDNSPDTLGWPKPGSPATASPSTMSWPDEQQDGVQEGQSHWNWPNSPRVLNGRGGTGVAAAVEGTSARKTRAQEEIRKEAFRDAVQIVKQQLFCQLRSCAGLEHTPPGSAPKHFSGLQQADVTDTASRMQEQDKKMSVEWNKVMHNLGSDENSRGMYIPAGDTTPTLKPNPAVEKALTAEPPSTFFPHGITIKEDKPKPVPKASPFWPFSAAGGKSPYLPADVQNINGVEDSDTDKRSKGPIFGGGALSGEGQPGAVALAARASTKTSAVARDQELEKRREAAAARTARRIVKELAARDLVQPEADAGTGHGAGGRKRSREEDHIIEQSAAAAAEKIVERMAAKDIANSLHIEKEARMIAKDDHRGMARPQQPAAARPQQQQQQQPSYQEVKREAQEVLKANADMLHRFQREQRRLDMPSAPAARHPPPSAARHPPPSRPDATHHAVKKTAPAAAAAAAGSGGAAADEQRVAAAAAASGATPAAAVQDADEAPRKAAHDGRAAEEPALEQPAAPAAAPDHEAQRKPTVPDAQHYARAQQSAAVPGQQEKQGKQEAKEAEEQGGDDVVTAGDMDSGVDPAAQQAAASRLARSVVSSAATAAAAAPAAAHGTRASESVLSSPAAGGGRGGGGGGGGGGGEGGADRPLTKGQVRVTFVLVGTDKEQLTSTQLQGFQAEASMQATSFGRDSAEAPAVSLPTAAAIPGVDSAVTLKFDMALPAHASCVSSLSKLAEWTHPDKDLLPLTRVGDAGPPTLRLINAQGCPEFAKAAVRLAPRATDSLAMQGTLQHMQQQQLKLEERVAAYARQEHREEARQAQTLQREHLIEHELLVQQQRQARKEHPVQTLASAQGPSASAAEQVQQVLRASEASPAAGGQASKASPAAGGQASKALRDEQALQQDVAKRAQEQADARKKLQQLEASFNQVAAKVGNTAAFKTVGKQAPAAPAQSENAQEASFLKQIRDFVSGKGGQHPVVPSPVAAPSPQESREAQATAQAGQPTAETSAKFITGAEEHGSSAASSAAPEAAVTKANDGASQHAVDAASDAIVDKALAAAGLTSNILSAVGISMPLAPAKASSQPHAPSPAAPRTPARSPETRAPAAAASTVASGGGASAGAGGLGEGSADEAAVVDRALAAAGITTHVVASVLPPPAPSPPALASPQVSGLAARRGGSQSSGAAASSATAADANAVIERALGAAGISVPPASAAASPSPALSLPPPPSPSASAATSGGSLDGGKAAAPAARAASPASSASSALVEKQQHEIQSALQAEEAKLRRVQARIDRRQAARNQALARAGVTATTKQAREQQASLKLQLDTQRLAQVQEELAKHKAQRLASSLQRSIQATATGVDRRDMLALASAKVESLRRQARRELQRPL